MATGYINLPVSGQPNYLSPVANAAALPVSANPGDVCPVEDTGVIYCWSSNSSGWVSPSGSGTVTSVALTVPGFLSVSGSPIVGAGTLAVSLATQVKNKVFVGPSTGSDAAPTFRLLVGADLPLPAAATLGGVFSKAAVSHNFLTSISSVDGSVGQAQPAFTDISGTASGSQLPLPAAATLGGVFSKAVVSHQFLTGISSVDGSVSQAQPAFSDISGTLAGSQLPTFTGDVTNSSAAMTVAKIAGVAVGTPTGTGNVVFSASPTFTGTAVLASATVSGTLKAGNYHIEPIENNAGNSSTALTIDLSTGSAQLVTLTGNCTFTLSNPVTGGSYVIRIATGAGSFTVTWPGTVKWSGGTAPTITATASKVDLINLYWDGTNYYGSFVQNF